MKKTILTVLLGAITGASALAQGSVTFVASGSFRPVQWTTDGTTLTKVAIGSPATIGTFGNMNITMYSATTGTVLTTTAFNGANVPNFTINGWAIATSPLIQAITTTAGNVTGTGVTLDSSSGAPGVAAEVEVVGWTGTSTTFAQALTAWQNGQALIGWSGSSLSLGGLGWNNATGSQLSPAGDATGASAFDGLVLVAPVPEPTTLALGGLGAAALLLFRRRK